MAADIDILQSTAKFGSKYYIEYEGAIRECILIATEGNGRQCWYLLQIAGIGTVRIEPKKRSSKTDYWYTSKIDSVLAESPEDISKQKYLLDWYGSTCNAYNSKFIAPFFPNYSVCGCGGGIHFWKWDGIRPELYEITQPCAWRIDENGFSCRLNDHTEGRYASSKQCMEANNKLNVVTFSES